MPSSSENRSERLSDGMKVTESEVGFASNELNVCPRCERKNAPNRASCMYCGQDIELHHKCDNRRFSSTDSPESWENATNLVFKPGLELSAKMLDLLGGNAAVGTGAIADGSTIPAARMRNTVAANLLQELDSVAGVELVDDSELSASTPPSRIRGMRLEGADVVFIDFNTGEKTTVRSGDIRLVVRGVLIETTLESAAKRSRKEAPNEIRTDTDRPVMDIYVAGDGFGRRILAGGFDFSLLGTGMALIASDNLSNLTAVLRRLSPYLRVDHNYSALRKHLDQVWELNAESDPFPRSVRVFSHKEIRRVVKNSNLAQFTKYSRLQARFL